CSRTPLRQWKRTRASGAPRATTWTSRCWWTGSLRSANRASRSTWRTASSQPSGASSSWPTRPATRVLAGPAWAQSAVPAASPAAPAASVAPPARVPALLPAVVPPLVAIQPPSAAVNPYGLRALWAQGDWVAQGTLAILAIMSLASWYVLITKLLAQSRMGGQGKAANKSFWAADSVRQGMEALQKNSPYRFIAESALEATHKHDGLIGQVDLNTWVAQS